MERMAAALGSLLASQLGLDEERQEVLTYGALVLIQNGVTALAILVVAALTGLLPQALAVMVAVATTRDASGGAHVQAALRCTVASTVALVLYAYLGKLGAGLLAAWPAALRVAAVAPVALVAVALIVRYAPVEAETRPLSPTHRARLRRLSLQVAALFLVLAVLGAFIGAWWTAPGVLGFLMQTLTLTPAGHRFAAMVDMLFIRLQRG